MRWILALVVLGFAAGFLNKPFKSHRGCTSRVTSALEAFVELLPGEFENEVIKASVKAPVVVDFMALWCGPCKLVAPIFKSLADEYDGKVQFVKVDTDVHEEYVDKYNIQGLPLFAIFKNGEVKAQHSGALTRDNLRAFIEKNVN